MLIGFVYIRDEVREPLIKQSNFIKIPRQSENITRPERLTLIRIIWTKRSNASEQTGRNGTKATALLMMFSIIV